MYLRDLKELLGKKDINTELSNKSFPYLFKINEINGKKYIDAVVISIAMPDEQSFEGMKHLAEYFFEDMSREMVTEKAGRKKEQERS